MTTNQTPPPEICECGHPASDHGNIQMNGECYHSQRSGLGQKSCPCTKFKPTTQRKEGDCPDCDGKGTVRGDRGFPAKCPTCKPSPETRHCRGEAEIFRGTDARRVFQDTSKETFSQSADIEGAHSVGAGMELLPTPLAASETDVSDVTCLHHTDFERLARVAASRDPHRGAWERPNKMTKDQINFAIWITMGRKDRHYFCPGCKINIPFFDESVSSGGYHVPKCGCGENLVYRTNYHGSLDACAEFEETLTEWEDREYRHNLITETFCKEHRATASQKCKCFLEVRNLWKERRRGGVIL